MSQFNMKWVDEFFDNKQLTIFDIGAFNFCDGIKFKINFPNSTVYCFEPFNYNINKYSQQAKSTGIKIFNLAMSDNVGKSKFYISEKFNNEEHTASGSLLSPSTKLKKLKPNLIFSENTTEVETTTINNFCEANSINKVDIIHMDVQGSEYYVVKGMGNKIKPKILFCETSAYDMYEGALTRKDLDELLFSMGYKIKERLLYDTLYILE